MWHPNGLPEEAFASLKDGWGGRIVPRVPIAFDREVSGPHTVCRSDAAVAARLNQALAVGANGFLLCFEDADDGIAQMRRFAHEVAPRLRGAR